MARQLKQQNFQFISDPASGIEDVRVRKLRLTSMVGRKERIVLEADPTYNPDAVYELLNKLQNPSMRLYVDKLDRRIDQNFYDQKSSEWKQEQDEIPKKNEGHQGANRTYFNEGLKLLELAQRAVILYEKQDMQEKRRIINFVCSNSIWKDGRLHPNYCQPFDMLAEINQDWRQEIAVSDGKNTEIEKWLGD
ncbi:MAG: hypothetical protein KAR13_07450, partial [Desulfobulbaceae bacterium]|nr:hypothetical protein [Desulfobulbaceae bacterium]